MKAFLTILLIFSSICYGKEITSFTEIEKQALSYAKKYGVDQTLVVLDIDNTVLTMPRQFGSDQWFSWQSKNCLGKTNNKSYCAASNFGELLNVQGQLFAISTMVPTEKITVKTIHNLQQRGFKVILLTSRGPEFRNSTELQLSENGLNFAKTAIGPGQGYGGTYLPYKLNNLNRYGLNQSDAKRLNLKKPRPVSYMNGVYMTAGQNKGVMLRNLLAKTNTDFKAIVFADDHKKHITRMNQAFEKLNYVEVMAFRYGAVDHLVKEFKTKPKLYSARGVKFLNSLKRTLNKTL